VSFTSRSFRPFCEATTTSFSALGETEASRGSRSIAAATLRTKRWIAWRE
jgi:hypothetical protein